MSSTPAQSSRGFVYVSEGSLFVSRPGRVPTRVESAFARQVQERAVALQRKHAWKAKGRTGAYRNMVWGRGAEPEVEQHAVFVSGGCVDGERLLYSQQSGNVAGVFRVNIQDDAPGEAERRLFHTTDLAVRDLGGVEQHGYLVCSLLGEKTASHIAVLHEDGSEVTELTAGDSVDRAPSWVPGRDRVLVYESAGIERDQQGHITGFSRSVISQLDVANSELALALELPGYDLLAPKVDGQGTLFCIRRNYKPTTEPNLLAALLRAVTAPFWLIYALFVWLSLFIQSYTGRRMLQPGQHEDVGDGQVRARLQTVGAEDAVLVEPKEEAEPPQWVRDRVLIRCQRDGKPQILAHGVVAYDVAADGSVVCSDGRRIFAVDSAGKRTEWLRAKDVSAVFLLAATAT